MLAPLAETHAIAGLELDGRTCRLNGKPGWHVTWSERTLLLRSDHADGAPPFTLRFNQEAECDSKTMRPIDTVLSALTPGLSATLRASEISAELAWLDHYLDFFRRTRKILTSLHPAFRCE